MKLVDRNYQNQNMNLSVLRDNEEILFHRGEGKIVGSQWGDSSTQDKGVWELGEMKKRGKTVRNGSVMKRDRDQWTEQQ